MITDDSKGKEGKSAVWRASFASPHATRSEGLHLVGRSSAPTAASIPAPRTPIVPTNTSTQIFDVAFLKVDSDKALEVAQKHGGDKLLAKDPDTPILYMLDWSSGDQRAYLARDLRREPRRLQAEGGGECFQRRFYSGGKIAESLSTSLSRAKGRSALRMTSSRIIVWPGLFPPARLA